MKYIITILSFAICSQGLSQKAGGDEILSVPALHFDSAGVLTIKASPTSTKHDFDFFAGKWTLQNRVQKKDTDGKQTWKEFKATQEMHIILNGMGNMDNFLAEIDGRPFEGMTLRLFNPLTRLWSIYWADSNLGVLGLPPVVGSFENKVGHFFSQDIVNASKIVTVYRWDARDSAKPVWSQGISEDNGKSWEWNWYMYMRK